MAAYKNEVKEDSAFRRSFKFFKSKENKFDSEQLIDVDDFKKVTGDIHLMPKFESISSELSNRMKHLNVKEPAEWKVYSFEKKPGLLLARNIFTNYGHYYWPAKCLQSYPAAPNVSNIEKDLRTLQHFNGNILKHKKLIKKLRWITMGYHHDWDTKVYSESFRSQIPSDLKSLSEICGQILGFNNYLSEAVIVNFYHLNSTLAGHVDHSERNMNAPLLSFSFGQSAIFLLGGITHDEEPSALYLRSGDLVVMTSSVRLAYHAVPRVVHDFQLPPLNDTEGEIDLDVVDYINNNRINMNVRQVN